MTIDTLKLFDKNKKYDKYTDKYTKMIDNLYLNNGEIKDLEDIINKIYQDGYEDGANSQDDEPETSLKDELGKCGLNI